MGEVIVVPIWGKSKSKNTTGFVSKMLACDQFIRSRFILPTLGSVVFNFKGGRVSITGAETHITGDDCKIVIRSGSVILTGSVEHAEDMFCSINKEIEELKRVNPS